MATTVTVAAHCSSDKEVVVRITNAGQPVEEFVLQDGEAADRVVYDDLSISVCEDKKAES